MIPCPAPVERDVANRYCGADVHGLGVDALNLWQKYRLERTLSCPLFVAPSPSVYRGSFPKLRMLAAEICYRDGEHGLLF